MPLRDTVISGLLGALYVPLERGGDFVHEAIQPSKRKFDEETASPAQRVHRISTGPLQRNHLLYAAKI